VRVTDKSRGSERINGGLGESDIEHVVLGSRRIDGQAAEGRGAELGKRSINTSRLGVARVDVNAARECKSARPGASMGPCE